MKRYVTALVAVSVLLGSCTERNRPDPFGPNSSVVLAADVLEPLTNESVAAGSTVDVRVHASERASRLAGIGFVARRFGSNAVLDSVAIHFEPVADTTHTFSLLIPADLATNTQIDIAGLAFATTLQSVRSSMQSVVVVPCPPGATCR